MMGPELVKVETCLYCKSKPPEPRYDVCKECLDILIDKWLSRKEDVVNVWNVEGIKSAQDVLNFFTELYLTSNRFVNPRHDGAYQ